MYWYTSWLQEVTRAAPIHSQISTFQCLDPLRVASSQLGGSSSVAKSDIAGAGQLFPLFLRQKLTEYHGRGFFLVDLLTTWSFPTKSPCLYPVLGPTMHNCYTN